jgi:hypothetical protein
MRDGHNAGMWFVFDRNAGNFVKSQTFPLFPLNRSR